MFTYAVLNLTIMALVACVMLKWRAQLAAKPLFYTLGTLLLLTLVFNSLIIYANIVNYNPNLILPIRIVNIPLEDFAYAVTAAVFIPYLWQLFDSKRLRKA